MPQLLMVSGSSELVQYVEPGQISTFMFAVSTGVLMIFIVEFSWTRQKHPIRNSAHMTIEFIFVLCIYFYRESEKIANPTFDH